MNRSVVAGFAAGAVVIGAGLAVSQLATPALPDVQIPAIQLSSADGDATVAWLDVFAQTSSGNPEAVGNTLGDPNSTGVPGEIPLIVIDPQTSPDDFNQILNGAVGAVNSQLSTVTVPDGLGGDLNLKNGS